MSREKAEITLSDRSQMNNFVRFNSNPVDLSQPYTHEMLSLPPFGRPEFTSCMHPLSGTEFRIGHISMSTHTGTHIDFPVHLLANGKSQEDFLPADFVGAAVVIDLSGLVKTAQEAGAYDGVIAITPDDLIAAGPEIIDGDIVLLHFGYSELFQSDRYRNQHPYLSESAAEYLVSKRVKILGLDLQTPDLPASKRGEGFTFPIHEILLSSDCLIIENLGPGVRTILGMRVFLVAAPLCIPEGDGSPVRPFAWIYE